MDDKEDVKTEGDLTEESEEVSAEKTENYTMQEIEELLDSIDKHQEDMQTETIIETPKGTIKVVHEITLGDLIVSTVLMAFLIFNVINQLIRRF